MNPHAEPPHDPESDAEALLSADDEAFLQSLRQLAPASPGAEWMQQALAHAPKPRRNVIPFWTATAAAVAACLAAGLWIRGYISSTPENLIPKSDTGITVAQNEPRNLRLRPVSLTRTAGPMEDQGMIMAGDQVWQRIRQVNFEESSWRATEGDRRVQVRVPREELILLPVKTY